MTCKMFGEKSVAVVALSLLTLVSSTATAETRTGAVSEYHLNSTVANRGVCIKLSPGLPGTGWACVWKDNPLYSEISQTLLQAQVNNRQCSIVWTSTDSAGHAIISMVSCY